MDGSLPLKRFHNRLYVLFFILTIFRQVMCKTECFLYALKGPVGGPVSAGMPGSMDMRPGMFINIGLILRQQPK